MAYRPTFSIDSIGDPHPRAEGLALRHMGALLGALIDVDEEYLAEPGVGAQIPLLYESGIRYDRLEPPPGSACGDDDWADSVSAARLKMADCFPLGTLLLRDDYELVPIEDVRVGDRIWGRDAWTTVEAHVYKGILSVDGLMMNNGSVAMLTGDHHAFVGRCDKHPRPRDDGYGCSCRLSERRIEKVRLRDLAEKDVLVTPERIPFGRGDMDPDRAYVEGLFVSDGWANKDYNNAFSISGQDGQPKEAQKREVEAICARLGIETRWARKSIAIKDHAWTLRVQQMGHLARNKRVLSMDLGEAAAIQTIRGLMADSNAGSGGNMHGGWTFTTTSGLLATQMRVLQRMAGRTTSTAHFTAEQHRGLGKHPIWRIGIRDPKKNAGKLLRVKRVERDVAEVPCYDIQTSDHYVYLPEHDVTVSNCEDLCAYRVAELRRRMGIEASAHLTLRTNGDRTRHSFHILVRWPDEQLLTARIARLRSDLARLEAARSALRGLRYPAYTFRGPGGERLEDPSRLLGM